MRKAILALVVVVLVVGAALAVGVYRFGWLNGPLSSLSGGQPGSAGPGQGTSQPADADGQPGAAPAPPAAAVAVAQAGQPGVNKAVELRVTNLRTAPSVGGRPADAGQEFVIVDTSWKNLLPPQRVNRKAAEDRTAGAGGLGFGGGTTAKDRAEAEANTTIEPVMYQVSPMTDHVWLLVDRRLAASIDTEATDGIDGHIPTDTLEIPKYQEVKSGSLAFQVPANAQALALLFLDSEHGHVLVNIKGTPPQLASSLGGASRGNAVVDLAVTGASWSEAAGSDPGMRTLVVGIRGISRQNALADVPFGEFGFLQTDQGCIAQPDTHLTLVRPLAPTGRFLPLVPTEGQVAFTVPADTRSGVFSIRASSAAPIDLPVLGGGAPQRPAARATFDDGSVLRVQVIGVGPAPGGLTAPEAGLEHVVVDYVVENLQAGQGLELQPEPQFALADAGGQMHPPDSASSNLPCRLSGEGVVPAGGWRRFSLLYTVAPGQPLTLKYRGFEAEGSLKVR